MYLPFLLKGAVRGLLPGAGAVAEGLLLLIMMIMIMMMITIITII